MLEAHVECGPKLRLVETRHKCARERRFESRNKADRRATSRAFVLKRTCKNCTEYANFCRQRRRLQRHIAFAKYTKFHQHRRRFLLDKREFEIQRSNDSCKMRATMTTTIELCIFHQLTRRHRRDARRELRERERSSCRERHC